MGDKYRRRCQSHRTALYSACQPWLAKQKGPRALHARSVAYEIPYARRDQPNHLALLLRAVSSTVIMGFASPIVVRRTR